MKFRLQGQHMTTGTWKWTEHWTSMQQLNLYCILYTISCLTWARPILSVPWCPPSTLGSHAPLKKTGPCRLLRWPGRDWPHRSSTAPSMPPSPPALWPIWPLPSHQHRWFLAEQHFPGAASPTPGPRDWNYYIDVIIPTWDVGEMWWPHFIVIHKFMLIAHHHGQQVQCLTKGFIKKMRDLPVQQAAEGHAQKSAWVSAGWLDWWCWLGTPSLLAAASSSLRSAPTPTPQDRDECIKNSKNSICML